MTLPLDQAVVVILPVVEPVIRPAIVINLRAHTIDGEQACIYGCTTTGNHQLNCLCTPTCPDHDNHCKGCAPRPTFHASLLCGSCFHRKLRSPLRRVPAIVDWLASRKAGLKAAVYDGDRVGGSKESPLPFNAGIVDFLRMMDGNLVAWSTRVAQLVDPGPGPTEPDAAGSAVWLEQHAGWLAEQDWVPQLISHLAELEQLSKRLAPWQRTGHKLPLPCFRCEQLTLVLFGGEDWVTCTNRECDEIINWGRYENLSRAIGKLYEHEGQAG